jgi:hypothetical protein
MIPKPKKAYVKPRTKSPYVEPIVADPLASLRKSMATKVSPLVALTPITKSAQPVVTGTQSTEKTNNLSKLKDLIPFGSNIINSLRKPPMPTRPGTLAPVQLSKVSYANERTEADRLVRGADLGAEKTLDGNTAASVRAGNLSQKFRMYSDSYSRENNENTDIANKQTLVNSNISEKNTRANDYYNQQKVERQIAQQGQQSANIANAADKYTALENEKGKRELEAKNFAITSKVFENSGVLKRLMKKLQDEGIDDPSNTKRKYGGKLKRAYK